uniref:Odorant receptor n=1 Tax=Glossina brevipalpis TaxID=37001 RepID=A0A1A9W9N3_9MUSC
MSVNTLEFFRNNWLSWKLLGIVPPKSGQRLQLIKYLFWSMIVNAIATISFPLHLLLGIFQQQSQSTRFESIAICVTSIATSLKFVIYASKLQHVQEMGKFFQHLDTRLRKDNEKQFYRKHIHRNVIRIQAMFIVIYVLVGVTATVAFIFSSERRLFYPGWLPFDWRLSNGHYMAAIAFQLISIFFQILQNFTNDSFTPKALCLLSGHIELLYKRVANIGYANNATYQQNRNLLELNECVLDQKHLYQLFAVIQSIISWPMFLQFLASTLNMCMAMVALLFFVTDILERIYYVMYFAAMCLQIFPTCYYGSDFEMKFERLHYAVFSSNWTNGTQCFKRHMLLFTERALRETRAMAGGIFRIHLDTFFATVKGAYSLFAVVITMKN